MTIIKQWPGGAIVRLDDDAGPSPPSVPALLDAYRRVRACPHREQCGCVYAMCSRYGMRVERSQCLACLEGNPPQPLE